MTIKIYSQNVRSLRTKFDECFHVDADGLYDVIVFSETWLNKFHVDGDFFPDQYFLFRADRMYVPGVVK